MSGLYSQYKTSPKLELEGVRAVVGIDEDGEIAFQVTRAGGANVRFAKVINRLTRPHQRNGVIKIDNAELSRDILKQAYAECIVIGWENVKDANGSPLTFSKETCLKLFRDLDDLFSDIVGISQDITYFREVLLEAQAKN
jgi:hypothetical protein